jgi:hypothetical protein
MTIKAVEKLIFPGNAQRKRVEDDAIPAPGRYTCAVMPRWQGKEG